MSDIQEEPNLNFQEASLIVGSIAVIFYFLIIFTPYYFYYQKKGPGIKHNLTLSKAFENTEQYPQVIIIYNFIFFMMWNFAYRGVLFNNDSRLAFPIAMLIFGISMSSILWIFTRNIISHTLFAILVILSGQIFSFIVYFNYKDVLEKDDPKLISVETFTWSSFIAGVILLLLFLFTKTSNFINTIATFEIIHMLLTGCLIITYITLPALPSIGVVQLPFTKQETNEMN